MVKIDDLSFKYGKYEVLSHISMTLERGKIYGLLGENGVGKTTLLKIISGLQKPEAGRCTAFGENPFNRTPSFLSRIYYLPEELEYIQTDLSPRQFAQLNGIFYPKFAMEKFASILREFDVAPDKKLNKLSQGQTKKAAIAFAISTNADLLLMDEPSNGLDIPSKTLFRQIMAEYCLDTTCTVISTHQVRDLENLIDPHHHSRQPCRIAACFARRDLRKTLFRTFFYPARRHTLLRAYAYRLLIRNTK